MGFRPFSRALLIVALSSVPRASLVCGTGLWLLRAGVSDWSWHALGMLDNAVSKLISKCMAGWEGPLAHICMERMQLARRISKVKWTLSFKQY